MSNCDLDDVYSKLKVIDYWKQPNYDICRNIIKFLDDYIEQNPKNARAYYLRSMAKFHLNNLVPPDDIMYRNSKYIKKKDNKSSAYDDYQYAISIDIDVVEKNPDIRVIITSCYNCLKFYFRKPCPYKVCKKILQSESDELYAPFTIIIFIAIISLIVLAVIFHNTSNLYYISLWILALCYCIYKAAKYSYSIIKSPLQKLYLEYCEKVEPATYEEIK